MREGDYQATAFGEPRRTIGAHSYVAYFPKRIPRTLELSARTVRLLADAEGALGVLAGVGSLLPNPELLIRPYLIREALSSTRIEGTQATLMEVLESDATGETPNADVEEVVNYVSAMRMGIDRLQQLPISVRLLREMHRELMAGVRAKDLSPGELRTTQNWIGPLGSTIETAPFVPPPPNEMAGLLSDWERFANETTELPLLVEDAILHAQFETIHPFLDGNGRLGRLMIVFFLVVKRRLTAPLLYLSSYLEAHRDEYYDSLQAIRERGDLGPWLELFLTAVLTQATDAVSRSRRILELRERYQESAGAMSSPNALGLVDLICANPIVTTRAAEGALNVSRPTALRLLRTIEQVGILSESGRGARGQRRYVATEMMAVVTGEETDDHLSP